MTHGRPGWATVTRRARHAGARRARHARELLYDVFAARVHGLPVSSRQPAELAGLARAAYKAGTLEPADDSGLQWRWNRSDLATVRHVAVISGVELLRKHPSPRLKQCPGDHCGWIFLDTTKRGNRRWCLMSEMRTGRQGRGPARPPSGGRNPGRGHRRGRRELPTITE
jgi:predicted RNA-binding Zn ribbon-like protein